MDVRRRISFSMNTGGGSTPDNPGTGGDISGPINTDNYLTILALEDGLTAKLSSNACQYCIDGDGNWIDLPSSTTTQEINSGQTLSFKGNLTPDSYFGIGRFTISKKCNLEGNCMSLLFGDDAVNNHSLSGKRYAFLELFYGCKTIIQVSESFLPATILASDCYDSMFRSCTSLTTAPELPATTLANSCYYYMFEGCTSLTTAPSILPATTLINNCYYYMFSNCRSLTTAPELPATTLVSRCYNNMFSYCTSLTRAPELPATTLAEGCYSSMFSSCSSLTTAPELPATTLANSCYNNMFYYCTSLTTAPELPATTLYNNCYISMFYYCTNLIVAPELPATTLTPKCYSSMFSGCRKLNYIKMLAIDISASDCLSSWVDSVSSTGTFVKHPAMTSLPTGTSGIPSGWTVDIATTYSIMYTSSDGNIVTPYKTDVFGANIVSNNYVNGQGVISFDGPVTAIGEKAFYWCENLTNVTIPDSVTTIGWAAFEGCSSLTSVIIPDSVTTIGDSAFRECSILTSITIPDSVTKIENSAFYYCISLTSVTIPDSVTEIGYDAFSWCSDLTSVYCEATTPPSLGGDYVFDENASGRKIYVPAASVEAYKSAYGWNVYASAIVGYNFKNIITFTVAGNEYQAEEGMTFYDWGMSDYYDSRIPLTADINTTFRESCELYGNTSTPCFNGVGFPYTPTIQLNSIIQPISYVINAGSFA